MACFDHFGENAPSYGLIAGAGLSQSCADDIINQLVDYTRHDDPGAEDEFFSSEQNARLVKNGEGYYRTMFLARGHPGAPVERKRVRPLRVPALERAISVIYQPQTERVTHYFHTRLPDQVDAIVHLTTTTAVEPIERTSQWDAGEPPETFPFGT